MDDLFEKWPKLASAYPRVRLATLPTPVGELTSLARSVGRGDLWLKDDGISSERYGGNKVRKLELLLGRALEQRRTKVLTFGYAGSNHAAATAVHAEQVGLRSISMLLPQATAPYVRRNLLVSLAAGAELHQAASPFTLGLRTVAVLARHTLRDRRLPMIIPPGGSSALGTIGFVGAAFELAQQIERGELPKPSAIYAAAGSLGTVVGLALGIKAAGLDIPVLAVRVADDRYVNARAAGKLFRATLALLRRAEPRFPRVTLDAGDLEIRHDQFGLGYALATEAGDAAVAAARDLERLPLDPTYTGKTMAALLADVREGRARSGPLLFWNTYNSVDLQPAAARATASELPPPFRAYFSPPTNG